MKHCTSMQTPDILVKESPTILCLLRKCCGLPLVLKKSSCLTNGQDLAWHTRSIDTFPSQYDSGMIMSRKAILSIHLFCSFSTSPFVSGS